MSLKTNAVMTSTPTNSWPCGKKITAPATTPRVPTKVTVLGLIPQRRDRLPSGAQTLVQNWRNLSSMSGSASRVRGTGPPPVPSARQQVAHLGHGRRRSRHGPHLVVPGELPSDAARSAHQCRPGPPVPRRDRVLHEDTEMSLRHGTEVQAPGAEHPQRG